MSPKEKLGHNAVRDVSVGVIQYPNQRLLNSNQMFASKPNYILRGLSINSIICIDQ